MNPLNIKKGTKAKCTIDFHPIFEKDSILTFVRYDRADRYIFEGKNKSGNIDSYYLMVNHFEIIKKDQLEFDFA